MTTPRIAGAAAWRPLLSGSLATRARKTVDSIAGALHQPPAEWIRNPFLAAGTAGMAIFYAYLALADDDETHADAAVALLGEALDAVGSEPTQDMLYQGFPGVAWTVEHLRGRLLDPDEEDEDSLEAIDQLLDEVLSGYTEATFKYRSFDLISGLVGLGVYALERLPRPWAGGFLERLVELLEAMAERRDEGFAWWTDPEMLPERALELTPRGYYNLGVAHGSPGVIALLARVRAAGVATDRVGPLLAGAVDWLLAQRLGPGCDFPPWVAPDQEPRPARSAWCYGTPGIAAALYDAGRLTGEESWQRQAVELALAAAARPPEEAAVRDACLCHGAAGLGHLFNRLYQATGEEELADAARFWFSRTLEMRRRGEGVAGYLYYGLKPDGEIGWIASPGVLEGAAGVGLALLAATSDLEPAWDRIFLASVEPRTDR